MIARITVSGDTAEIDNSGVWTSDNLRLAHHLAEHYGANTGPACLPFGHVAASLAAHDLGGEVEFLDGKTFDVPEGAVS